MIYTLTLNPSIDYIMNVENYTEGVVNRTFAEALLPGGKGINVSIVLDNLGVKTTALGFVAGFSGNMIEDMLKDIDIKYDFVHLGSGFSRINVKIKSQTETEINASGPKISADMLKKLYEKLDLLKDGDTLVLAGSVPSSVPSSIYPDIMQRLSGKDIRFVVDATKELLTNSLKYKPFLIKPNNFELEEIFKKPLNTDEDIIRCGKKLQSQGAKNVLISLGKDGGILLSESGQIYKAYAPKGKVINTTGAGDSLVAGFLAAASRDNDMATALKTGICAGSASAFSSGLATAAEVSNLMSATDDPVLLNIN